MADPQTLIREAQEKAERLAESRQLGLGGVVRHVVLRDGGGRRGTGPAVGRPRQCPAVPARVGPLDRAQNLVSRGDPGPEAPEAPHAEGARHGARLAVLDGV